MLNLIGSTKLHRQKPVLNSPAQKKTYISRQDMPVQPAHNGFDAARYHNAQKMLSFGAIDVNRLPPNFIISRQVLDDSKIFYYDIKPELLNREVRPLTFSLYYKESRLLKDYEFRAVGRHENYEAQRKKQIVAIALYAAITDLIKLGRENSDEPKRIFIKKTPISNTVNKETANLAGSLIKNFEKDENGLYLSEDNFNSALEEIKNFLKESLETRYNPQEVEKISESWERFNPSIVREFELEEEGQEFPFKDEDSGIEIILKKREGKIYLNCKNEEQRHDVRIDPCDWDAQRDHVIAGDAIYIGENVYLFDRVENTAKYELRLLSKAGPRKFGNIYSDLIHSKTDFYQRKVGNCYFLAALKALLMKPGGKELICRMVDKNPETGDYEVRFPGYEQGSFRVTQEVLNHDASKFVSGPDFVRVLEKGFGQLRERLGWYDENKFPDSPPGQGAIKDWLKGGYECDVFYILTGKKGDKLYCWSSKKKEIEFKEKMRCFKDNFRDFGLCLTIHTEHGFTTSTGIRFEEQSHTYTISDIDTEKEKIELINPHDTTKRIKISYEDVLSKDYYSDISYVYLGNGPLPPEIISQDSIT